MGMSFWGIKAAAQVKRLSRQVAQECHAQIISQLADDAQGMNLAELRGYVRALAGGSLRVAAAKLDLAQVTKTQVTVRATDLVIESVAKEISQRRLPQRRTGVRRAA